MFDILIRVHLKTAKTTSLLSDKKGRYTVFVSVNWAHHHWQPGVVIHQFLPRRSSHGFKFGLNPGAVLVTNSRKIIG